MTATSANSPTDPAPAVSRRPRAGPLVAVGSLAALAGVVGLAVIAYWYAVDMGWTGSGSLLVEPRGPIAAAALVAASAAVYGTVTILVAADVPIASARGGCLLSAALLSAAAVPVAVDAYPQVRRAELIAHSPATWRAQLPLSDVWGVSDETDDTVTVVGTAMRRGCDWHLRAVTLDKQTGHIAEVRHLPRAYEGPSEIPPYPRPLPPEQFEVAEGGAPFICRS